MRLRLGRRIRGNRRAIGPGGMYGTLSPTYGSVRGGPAVTIGSYAGSGCNFDPGTNPTPGDTLGTDCAAALQAALNWCAGVTSGSPFNANRPALLKFQAGSFRFWNSGTTPVPILIQSLYQRIEGAGPEATDCQLFGSTALTIPAPTSGGSPYTYTNGNAYAVMVTIGTNGCTWSGTPIEVGGTAVQAPTGSGSTATAWNAYVGAICVCVAPGQTLTLTYSAGAPSLAIGLSWLVLNIKPNGSVVTGGCFGLSVRNEVATASNQWARFVDYSSDPNNGLGYAEAGQQQPHLENVETYAVSTSSPATDCDLCLDGMGGAVARDCFTQGTFSNVSPVSTVVDWGGDYRFARFGGQTVLLFGTIFGPVPSGYAGTIPSCILWGSGAANDVLAIPMKVVLIGAYWNARSAIPLPLIQNFNSVVNTYYYFLGGDYQISSGTAPTGYLVGNEGTSEAYISGKCRFLKSTNNPTPLFGVAPLGVILASRPIYQGAQTEASFLTNAPQGWQASTPGVPSSGSDATNTADFPVEVYISGVGSGITAVGITDPVGTLTSFTVSVLVDYHYTVEPGGKIRLTYTGSPTWKWYGKFYG